LIASTLEVLTSWLILLMVQKSQTTTGWMYETLKIMGNLPYYQLVQDFSHQQFEINGFCTKVSRLELQKLRVPVLFLVGGFNPSEINIMIFKLDRRQIVLSKY